ncbi:hypothetical protein HK097_001704, partial [Rhizophlyctis rosea]
MFMGKLKPLPTDPVTGKANLLRPIARFSPHLLAFYLAWLGHFSAFCSWFALSPLLTSTIAPDLHISLGDVASSDIANVASTIVFRLVVGAVTDKVGPKKAMAVVLVLGAIPLAFTALVTNAGGLIAVRLFVGLLGASFVPCQAWTTTFFTKSIVGTANAVAGGLGNSGAGVTYLLTPLIFDAFVRNGLTISKAWRITLLFPAAFCWVIAGCCLLLGPVKPEAGLPVAEIQTGSTVESGEIAPIEEVAAHTGNKKKVENIDSQHTLTTSPTTTFTTQQTTPLHTRILKTLTPTLLLLIFQYSCSFGIELSVNSTLSSYLQRTFPSQMSQTTASMLASTLGLLNIISRATGGVLSDFCMTKLGIRGRLYVQFSLLLLTSIAVLAFSFAPTLPITMTLLVVFAFCTESASGSLFGILPYAIKEGNMGLASGMVGAGGTIGGAVFNAVFKALIGDPRMGFRIVGG